MNQANEVSHVYVKHVLLPLQVCLGESQPFKTCNPEILHVQCKVEVLSMKKCNEIFLKGNLGNLPKIIYSFISLIIHKILYFKIQLGYFGMQMPQNLLSAFVMIDNCHP